MSASLINSLLLILSLFAVIISIFLGVTKSKKYYIFTITALLLLPKVNLISVPGVDTGIRCDDLLILFFVLIKFEDITKALVNNKKIRLISEAMLLLVLVGFISTVVGLLMGTVQSVFVSVLTTLRKLEYFICVFLGYYFISGILKNHFIKWLENISFFLFIICILQQTGVLGYVHSGRYVNDSVVATVFNGGYEYACFCCIILAILLYNCFKLITLRRGIACIVLFYQIVFSQSRSGLILSLIIILLECVVYNRKLLIPIVAIGSIFVISILFGVRIAVLERFRSLDVSQMFDTLFERISNGDYFAALKDLPTEQMFPNYSGDLSFYVRTTKWGAAFDGFIQNILLGYGPGQLAVLDGSYVKLLCESGIVSFVIFAYILYKICVFSKRAKTPFLLWVVLTIACFALFIDIFESSKIMELFWMLTAACLVREPFLKTSKSQKPFNKKAEVAV